jgi:hypothetical protein
MRFPEKYMTLVVVGVAVLAGLGAARVLSGQKQPWRRTATLLLLLVAIGVATPFVFPYPWSGFMFLGLRHGAVAVAALLGVQVLAARASRLVPALLVATVTLDLATSAWGLQGFVPRTIATGTPPAARLVKSDHAAHLEPARIYRSSAVDVVMNQRAATSNAADGELRLLATLVPNTVNLWGIASLPGYDAAIPARFERLWHAGWSEPATRLATLRLLGTDYAILPARGAHDMPGVELLAQPAPGTRLVRVPRSLPQVFLAGRGEAAPDDQALRMLFEPTVVAGETALLAPAAPALAGPPGRAGICTLTSYSPRRLSAHCQAEREALAVFVEQYHPGWRATVDGQPARIEQANLVMRALRLAPGAHDITLVYHAPGLWLGLAITLLSLAGSLGMVAAARLKRRRRAPARTVHGD